MPIFSGFSAAILRDSGWYVVQESLVEQLITGKNEGCEWEKGCKGNLIKPIFVYYLSVFYRILDDFVFRIF